MIKMSWIRSWSLVAALGFVVTAAPPATAQSSKDVAQQIEREYGVIGTDSRDGRRLNAMLDDVVQRMTRAVNRTSDGGDFQLQSAKILGGKSEKNDKVINAFALPDGRIYVTLGLLRAIEGSPKMEDELAFVVGHEITHVTEHHSASQQKKALPVSIIATILGAATRNRAIGGVATAGAAAYVSSFSRKDEYRADRGGLMAMSEAGYDPEAAVSMLERLKSAGEDKNKTFNGWFGSHPLTGNRVDKVQDMIREMDSGRRPAGEERNLRRR